MPRILVIDDEPEITEVLRDALEAAGYDVLIAQDGDAGIALCRQSQIDLVLTDIVMPHRDGIETIIELRRLFPSLKIIAMSGGGTLRTPEYLRAAALLGSTRTISKPFALRDVVEAVDETLAQ